MRNISHAEDISSCTLLWKINRGDGRTPGNISEPALKKDLEKESEFLILLFLHLFMIFYSIFS